MTIMSFYRKAGARTSTKPEKWKSHFTPGLSGSKVADDAEETTLQQYLRRQKEKRKRKKWTR